MARPLLPVFAAALALLLPACASAQAYPDKTVHIVVPYVAGGNLDVTARLFADGLSQELGKPFVVENRPGANGNVGMAQVARQPADGYMLALVSVGTLAINPALYRNPGFDPEADFAPISIVSTAPMLLVTSNALPFRKLEDVIEEAKRKPGTLNFGSGGSGTLAHLSTEMLRVKAKINIVHVPYRGAALALSDVIAGHVQLGFDTLNTSAPLALEGKLRPIAVTSPKRNSVLPNVPTMIESGLPDFDVQTWAGLVAPAGTPAEVVRRLHGAVVTVAARERTRAQLAVTGSEAVANTPEQFATQLRNDRRRWAEVVKESRAKVE